MQYNFESIIDALVQSDPLTAIIIVLSFLAVLFIHLYFKSKTVEAIFDNINILMKSVLLLVFVSVTLGTAYTLPPDTGLIKFALAVIAAMIATLVGIMKFDEQKQATEAT